jgi:MFS family permease
VIRRIERIQAVSAVAEGATLSTVVLYFTQVVGLPETSVGHVLAAAALASALLAAPMGILADRIGLSRSAAILCSAVAVALAGYAVAGSLWLYAAAALLFGVARTGLGAVVQGLVAAQTAPADRVRARARLHTVLNAGFGAGALLGAGILAADRPTLLVAVFGAGALTALACSAALLATASPVTARGLERRARTRALADRRLLAVTALSSVLHLTIPMLSVLLPLWVTRSPAPLWVAAAGFGLNTALVVALQSRWSTWVRTDTGAKRSAVVAGVAIASATLLFALAPGMSTTAAVVTIVGGVVAMTVGEVATGPAAWHLALRDVPADRQGEYQSVFGMSFSISRVLGPLVALPLITTQGSLGWLLLGGAVLTAGLLLAAISSERSSSDDGVLAESVVAVRRGRA